MSADDTTVSRLPIAAGMFRGPARLRPFMRVLRRFPSPVAARVLAGLAIGDGVLRNGRHRRALSWAAAQGIRGWARHRLALALLANHGRFVAEEAMLGVSGDDDLRRNVVIEGAERLRTASGAILLGFHLGPPKAWLCLRALGHPVRFAGRLEGAAHDPRWQPVFEVGDAIRLPGGDAQSRVGGLYRIRRFLQEGALIYLTADGPFGREAFRIDLPGGPLVVRAGWLALRRATQVPILPVLTHRLGNRRVIVIHPPLPDPDDDPVRDAAACRAALTPLVESYLRRFPSQCRWIAMPRWPAGPSATSPASSAS